ncbi:hypothetical protein B484DRAFT_450152 [Ochromonadaceae sp. CCMP2298]|nr:hypothetical protein B484DRAFT_450152 [Ochromonadaceae sp. CCMP2298]
MASSAMLLNKKTINKLGLMMNDSAASKPSAFALRQMQKMGWVEGSGLGKDGTGITESLKIKKREESTGLGLEKVAEVEVGAWWHDAFSSNLKLIKSKMKATGKTKDKKRKKGAGETETEEGEGSDDPSYADLFKATGGARLGMRARADQKGKWRRTEAMEKEVAAAEAAAIAAGAGAAVTVAVSGTGAGAGAAGTSEEEDVDTADAGVATEAYIKAQKRKEKKAKKDKKEKREKGEMGEKGEGVMGEKKEEEEKKEKKGKRSKIA